MKPARKVESITDLIPDDLNINKGTKRGRDLLEQSVERNGIGRGIVISRDAVIGGGNKTVEALVDKGFTKVVVVPTDGTTLVVTQRVDLDSDDPRFRELALADNRVQEVSYDPDPDMLKRVAEEFSVPIADYYFPDELSELFKEEPARARVCPHCGGELP